jgi:hypothetical protein
MLAEACAQNQRNMFDSASRWPISGFLIPAFAPEVLRRLFAHGIMAEKPECVYLAAILDEARFKQPKRRWTKLKLHHVEAFIVAAIAAGRVSLALGTALQFETTLRQRDVIGEWEPVSPDGTPLPILPYTFLTTQKSGLAARGTSASFPGYHWMFSAQASSAQSAGPPPLP